MIKVKKYISILLCLFCSSSLSGCNNYIRYFYTLTDAYNNGYITRADLLNIAYYYNGMTNVNDENFVPTEILQNDLSKKTIKAIKNTYLATILENDPNATIEGVHISRYFGKYGDCVSLSMRDDYTCVDLLPSIEEYIIDGVKFINYIDGLYGLAIWK